MSSDATVTDEAWLGRPDEASDGREVFHLVLLWSLAEPERVGEASPIPRGESVLGRGAGEPGEARHLFAPMRPGGGGEPRALGGSGLSRRQLVFSNGASLTVENVGRGGLRVNGRPVGTESGLRAGDVLTVERQASFFVTRRDPGLYRARPGGPTFPFGRPDPLGLVGESPAAWMLRDAIAFAAKRVGHVLVTGPSGSGKELCARGLHALSSRAAGPFVARNAATFPSGIVDAEVFGHAKNYPNAGMPDRQGLVGEAHGGTLFLDEIGELQHELQAHLLRLLDGGEYHRLGESQARRVDLRFVGATNREVSSLKHDFAERLTLRVEVPSLAARREDVPLLARAILERAAARDPGIAEIACDPATGRPRFDPELVELLVLHEYGGEVRELERLLMEALGGSRGGYVAATPALRARLSPQRREPPTKEEIVATLARHGGNATKAFPDLGLPSRDALYRLMRKHGL